MSFKRARLALVAGAAALTVSAAAAAPASAQYSRCPDTWFCAFTGQNGNGVMAQFKWGDANLNDANGPTGMSNNIQSVWNRRADAFIVYANPGCSSTPWITIDGGEKRSFATGGFWSNQIESLRYLHSPPSGDYIC